MSQSIFSRAWILHLALTSCFTAGCGNDPQGEVTVKPPVVTVSRPLSRQVTEYEELNGRTEAVESVEVRARVSGYLEKVNFKEGDVVEKGKVLFEIDPRPYAAELKRSQSKATVNQANLTRRKADLARNKPLAEDGTITAEDWDQYVAAHDEADAAVKAAQADVDYQQLNVDFTKVVAPIGGRASQHNISVGNLVNADVTLLTDIVSIDPVHAYFDVSERVVLRVQRLIRKGELTSARLEGAKVPVWVRLDDETGFPHEGYIDFVDNRVDPSTGTVKVRGIFENDDGMLSPGLFVKVRVNVSRPKKALLVNERALGTDQGQKFLLVVKKDETVEYRAVKVGTLEEGLRVIESGLSAADRVIVNGLQRVRPGVKVSPKLVDMPQPPSAGKSRTARQQASKRPRDTQ